ncbi:MAG: hypothetical protein PVSMB2_11880 [Ktedonobacteraceae bacterium]
MACEGVPLLASTVSAELVSGSTIRTLEKGVKLYAYMEYPGPNHCGGLEPGNGNRWRAAHRQ